MRAIWSGNISFGLISIPVKLYSASRARPYSFKFLRKADLCPVKNIRVCEGTDEKVSYNDIVRGYHLGKGEYVTLTDEDLKRADAGRSPSIDVIEFVAAEKISAKYFEKPYYIEPQKNSEKAYVLLREALKKSKKVAIARFAMKTREHLAAIEPSGKFLMLNQMRYQNELLEPEDLNIRETEISEKELNMAERLIGEMAEEFRPQEFEDKRSKEIEKIIRLKAKGELPKIKEPVAAPGRPKDIMAQLKESLEMARRNKE